VKQRLWLKTSQYPSFLTEEIPGYVNQFSAQSEVSLCKIAWQTDVSCWSTRNLLHGFSSLSIRVHWHLFSTIVRFHMTCYVNKKRTAGYGVIFYIYWQLASNALIGSENCGNVHWFTSYGTQWRKRLPGFNRHVYWASVHWRIYIFSFSNLKTLVPPCLHNLYVNRNKSFSVTSPHD